MEKKQKIFLFLFTFLLVSLFNPKPVCSITHLKGYKCGIYPFGYLHEYKQQLKDIRKGYHYAKKPLEVNLEFCFDLIIVLLISLISLSIFSYIRKNILKSKNVFLSTKEILLYFATISVVFMVLSFPYSLINHNFLDDNIDFIFVPIPGGVE